MLTLPPSVRIYLAVGQVDMRRGHDGLAAIVHGQWKLDLYGGHLFVFLGRRRDRCKILFWELTVETLHGLQAVREGRPSPWRFTRFGIGRYQWCGRSAGLSIRPAFAI